MALYDAVWLNMRLTEYVWLYMTNYVFTQLCMALYYMFIYDFDTLYDYWLCFCKTLLDTVWLCKNQFHLYWLFLTLFYSVWLNFILCCLVRLKLFILNHVWTGLTVFDSVMIFLKVVWFFLCKSSLLCLNLLEYISLYLSIYAQILCLFNSE